MSYDHLLSIMGPQYGREPRRKDRETNYDNNQYRETVEKKPEARDETPSGHSESLDDKFLTEN